MLVPVRMLTGLAGPTVNVAPGEVFWCDEALAARFIAAGAAEAVADATPVANAPETAMTAAPERAIRRRGRPRRSVTPDGH